MTERESHQEQEAKSPLDKLKQFVHSYREKVIAKYSTYDTAFILGRKRSEGEVHKVIAKEVAIGIGITAGAGLALIGVDWIDSSVDLATLYEVCIKVPLASTAIAGLALSASSMLNLYILDKHYNHKDK